MRMLKYRSLERHRGLETKCLNVFSKLYWGCSETESPNRSIFSLPWNVFAHPATHCL